MLRKETMLALEGVKILSSALQYPGPYCTMLLADLGAEVIKLERPGLGDPARQFPGFFRSINRNKKSLTLDLKRPRAQDILGRLIKTCDVFLEGFRPGVADKLNIAYQTLSSINPRLVYCSISGYGQTGPYRNLPGHDLNYQAMAGMLTCFQDARGDYITPQLAIGDLSAGMFATLGIMAALMAREKTGLGQYVDVSMFDGLLSWMGTSIGGYFDSGVMGISPDPGYGVFRAGDGKYFTLGIAHEDWFWERLCQAIGLTDLSGLSHPERYSRKPEIVEALQKIFDGQDRDTWVDLLKQTDVPVAPVQTLAEVVVDPQVVKREMIQELESVFGGCLKQVAFPVRLSQTPGVVRTPPPEVSQHTDDILKTLGYSEEEMADFKKEGII